MTDQTSGRWHLGLALSLVATLLWGTLPVALKIVLTGMDPATVVFYRFGLSALLLGLFLHRRGWLPRISNLSGRMLTLLAVAVLGCVGNNVIFLFGLRHISPSAAQVLIQLAPMLLLTGAVLLYKEPFSRWQWAGFVTLTAGLGLFFNERLSSLLQAWDGYTFGLALIVVAAMAWAAFALAQKRLLRQLRSGSTMWSVYAAGFVLLLPLSTPGEIIQLDRFQLLVLAYCGINTLVGYGCFAEALAHWEASRVSAVVATTPLITVALMAVLSRIIPSYLAPERLNLAALAGAGMVVAGSILAALGSRPSSPIQRPSA